MLPNISPSEIHQAMELGQVIEYNKENTFFKNVYLLKTKSYLVRLQDRVPHTNKIKRIKSESFIHRFSWFVQKFNTAIFL